MKYNSFTNNVHCVYRILLPKRFSMRQTRYLLILQPLTISVKNSSIFLFNLRFFFLFKILIINSSSFFSHNLEKTLYKYWLISHAFLRLLFFSVIINIFFYKMNVALKFYFKKIYSKIFDWIIFVLKVLQKKCFIIFFDDKVWFVMRHGQIYLN